MTTTEIKALAAAALVDRLHGFAVVGCTEAGRVMIERKLAPTAAELAFEAVCRPMPAPLPTAPANPALAKLAAAFKAAKRT